MVRLFSFILLSALLSTPLIAREQIKIGAAHFLPFIDAREGKPIAGAITDLVMALNQIQTDFQFIIVPTSPKYRHMEFKKGLHDLSMFDNIEWGWDKPLAMASKPYLFGGEVYITQTSQGRDERYFADLNDKKMIGVAGYHYGFANFNSDPTYLKTHYQMRFTQSNLSSIKMVLAGNRGDVAVVTKSFLNQYLSRNPKDHERILVSKKLDQEYRHTMVIRKGINLTVQHLNGYIDQLQKTGVLTDIWRKHEIL